MTFCFLSFDNFFFGFPSKYCMPQRVGQHNIISCAEPCTATKFLHLVDNVDSALEAIQFENFLALFAGNFGFCVFVGAFW